MSRSLLTCVIAAALVAAPHLLAERAAPSHPDFSGTWRVGHVDTTASTDSGGLRRGGFGGGGFGGRFGRGGRRGFGAGSGRQGAGAGADAARLAQGLRQGEMIDIRQTTDHLILTTHTDDSDAQMISYALDGKETKNTISDTVTINTKAKWKDATLVTDTEQTFSSGRGSVARKVHEVLMLTDSDTLTVQSTTDTGFGKRTATATLTRVPQ